MTNLAIASAYNDHVHVEILQIADDESSQTAIFDGIMTQEVALSALSLLHDGSSYVTCVHVLGLPSLVSRLVRLGVPVVGDHEEN